uniref:Resistin n=1 Tax=Chrysemys picta bellii TaxID=8478 RepID=A0A8C3FMN2_CHRPI
GLPTLLHTFQCSSLGPQIGDKPTDCACGMGCDSWYIRMNSTCYCQCGGINWTAMRCCKIVL